MLILLFFFLCVQAAEVVVMADRAALADMAEARAVATAVLAVAMAAAVAVATAAEVEVAATVVVAVAAVLEVVEDSEATRWGTSATIFRSKTGLPCS